MRRIKLHELRATVRIVLAKDMTWPNQSELYSRLEKSAIASFLKSLGPLIVGYLVASSFRNGSLIGFNVSSLDVFAPASYFLFFLSFAFLMNAVAFNHLSIAMGAKAALAAKIRIPGFSVVAYDVINERSENGLGIPEYGDRFHKGMFPIRGLLQILFGLVFISVLMPIGALGFFLVSEQVALITLDEISLLERICAAMGVVAIATATLFIVFFHLPMPMKKNSGYIRWNFLYWLPPHASDDEKFKRWIAGQDS